MNRPKILVADRDKNILSAFSNYLRKKNYSMTGVSNVSDGLEKIRRQNFNLLITDVRVDSEFGKDFIIKAKDVQKDLPIIAITSYPDKISESDLKICGANCLFVKPLEIGKLDKAIESCLQLNSLTKKESTNNNREL
jgi:DNA-binding NtrC family response regulator